MKTNSTSSGVRRIRSINVRANILSEWTADQIRFRIESTRYLVGVALCLGSMVAVIPLSEHSRSGLVAIQEKREGELKELKAQFAEAAAAQKAAEPSIATSTLRTQTATFFNRLMGETFAVLDAANSGMAFATAKVDVRDAEIVIDCRADAENYDAAAAFAEQAGSTRNLVSSLASTRPSALLGPSGISFEYLKRVDLK